MIDGWLVVHINRLLMGYNTAKRQSFSAACSCTLLIISFKYDSIAAVCCMCGFVVVSLRVCKVKKARK